MNIVDKDFYSFNKSKYELINNNDILKNKKSLFNKLKYYFKQLFPPILIKLIKRIKYECRHILYNQEVVRRRAISFFDVKAITKDMNLVTNSYGFNAFYGLNNLVATLLGKIDGCYAIEHGVNFNLCIDDFSAKADTIIVMSEEHKRLIESTIYGKKVIAIGPYIKYAKASLSEADLNAIRKKLGKTLLVFPSHSTHYELVKYDIDAFIAEIERIRLAYNFQTVLVCAYWKDYLCGFMKKYQEKYILCSAGHIFDPYFLCRLRSIIECSDMVIGNDLGTNIGYCISLGKPYYFFVKRSEIVENCYNGDLTLSKSFNKRLDNVRAEFIKVFGHYNENITKEEIALVEKYWGKALVD